MDPRVTIEIHDGPLPTLPAPTRDDCGAVIDFHGVVRRNERGQTIAGLHYDAYRPMAEREVARIVRELIVEFPCREIFIAHRLGFVPVGEASIVVRIASPHRGEAILFLEQFMNRLKQDVPIWKQTSPSVAPKI